MPENGVFELFVRCDSQPWSVRLITVAVWRVRLTSARSKQLEQGARRTDQGHVGDLERRQVRRQRPALEILGIRVWAEDVGVVQRGKVVQARVERDCLVSTG